MLIVSSSTGRMGNQLILHAHILAFVREHGFTAYFPRLHPYRKLFEGLGDGLVVGPCLWQSLEKYFPKAFAAWFFRRCGNLIARSGFENSLVGSLSAAFDLPPLDVAIESPEFIARTKAHKVLFLLGFRFRGYHYVIKHRKYISQYFRPVKSIREQIEEVEQAGRKDAEILVGVHIRQGDYADFLGGKFYFTTETYVERMYAVQKLFEPRKVAFLVVSENLPDPANFSDLTVVFGPGFPVGDIYSLARCDYIFGVPSTFSKWAAYIGEVPHWIINDTSELPTLDKFKVDGTLLGYPPQHVLDQNGIS